MALVDSLHCNTKTISLLSGFLTLDCSNMFAMTPQDRMFVLDLLESLEAYELEASEAVEEKEAPDGSAT